MTRTNKRHAAAVKAADEETIAMDVIRKLSRKDDLEKVKLIINFHGFGPSDLFDVEKAKRKPKAGGNVVKKTTTTPRKVTAKTKKLTAK
jgi:hypothetical protein